MKENLKSIWVYAQNKFKLSLMLFSILLASIFGVLFPLTTLLYDIRKISGLKEMEVN